MPLEIYGDETGTGIRYGDASLHFGADGGIRCSPAAGQALTETGGGYDVAAFLAGVPGADAILLRHVAARAFTLLPTGSVASAGTAATAETVLTVQQNGEEIATITFAADGATGLFAAGDAFGFAAGDVLAVVAPHTPDDTLADIAVTLKGAL